MNEFKVKNGLIVSGSSHIYGDVTASIVSASTSVIAGVLTSTTSNLGTFGSAINANSVAITNANIDTGDIANAVVINKSPVITLGGDLSGDVTLTSLGNGTLTATIVANSVALGTDTSGNYISTITTSNGVLTTGASSGETIAHALSVDSGSMLPYYSSSIFGTVSGDVTITAAGVSSIGASKVTSTMILDGTILNADINSSAAIVDTKLATISTALKVSNSATTATDANTSNAIVKRDGSGHFGVEAITFGGMNGPARYKIGYGVTTSGANDFGVNDTVTTGNVFFYDAYGGKIRLGGPPNPSPPTGLLTLSGNIRQLASGNTIGIVLDSGIVMEGTPQEVNLNSAGGNCSAGIIVAIASYTSTSGNSVFMCHHLHTYVANDYIQILSRNDDNDLTITFDGAGLLTITNYNVNSIANYIVKYIQLSAISEIV